ncbi:hypothetical protein ACEN2P_08135 [Pedobacter psychrotolerans]|uniref:hypothetical protein n=1 Tax=Pedobacter psychrotolerans TaxID=1843235 RepID=UPI003F98577A
MSVSFSPSVNIIRDEQNIFNYIPTPNANLIVNRLQEDFLAGVRSFTLIGSYGSGKSSFLLALEQTLTRRKIHFELNFFADSNVKFIKIVGSYGSVIDSFSDYLDVKAENNKVEHILSELYNQYYEIKASKRLLVVVIDELGKFLEYAAKNNPEKELYFLQQLAEFANNQQSNIMFITTVHQGFETYGYELNKNVRHEWSKVKGRFKELTFNEPVEQLLFLASEHISHATKILPKKKQVNISLSLFDQSKAFKADYSKEIADKLFPLDLLSANVLTLGLQRYGQNERSLFGFLESTDLASLSKFVQSEKSPFYALSNVFDYLINNFFSFLNSKFNPDSASWSAIKISIEQVENSFDENLNDYLKLIKTIGLLNTFSSAGSVLDNEFLTQYAINCLGIQNPAHLIEKLIAKSIIRYRKHSKRFVLTEETEVDIELALLEATNSVSEITDVPTVLKKYFEFTPVLAKEYAHINGTARYFKFEITEYPKAFDHEGEIDGCIQLIFSDEISEETIRAFSEDGSANIYVFYKNAREIKALLFDLEKTVKVLGENQQDRVAKRELESIIIHQKALLNYYILNNLYEGSKDILWFWNGQIIDINSKKSFNKLLTRICQAVYYATPIFKNELVNKHKISTAIHTAKRNYFKGLANYWDQKDLGIPETKFPPEKMIYKSLLEDNGLQLYKEDGKIIPQLNEGDSFYSLWIASNNFLNSAKENKKSILNFYEILSAKPFKLKQGFIDFWIPTFLFLKRDDFALYADNVFVPVILDDTLELISKKPKDFQLKAFDIDGVRLDIFNSYRVILEQETKDRLGNISFIETIKPFLVFYKTLPDYAKKTNRLSRPAFAIREAIAKSKDPEFTFFEAFPSALGTSIKDLNDNPSLLTEYTQTLQNAIREIRTCYDELVERFENFIKQDILFEDQSTSFEGLKSKLQGRYSTLKRHLLLQKQKSFVQRVDSQLEDKKAWLSSICQSLLGKNIETLSDEDELLLHDSMKLMVQDLDGLMELSGIEIDETKESIYNIQLSTFGSVPLKNIVRISKANSALVNDFADRLEVSLTDDRELNKLILTTLLQKILSNE